MICRLKPLVFARLGAELTVLVALAILPLVLLACGQFTVMHWTIQVLVVVLALVAGFIIWGALQIPWQVAIDEKALVLRSTLKQVSIQWGDIQTLKLITSWGWRRYQVSHTNGNNTFPAWMTNQNRLIDEIRSRVPNRAMSAPAGKRVFTTHLVTLSLEIGKTFAGGGLAALLWVFFDSLRRSSKSWDDLAVILAGCLILSALVLCRLVVNLVMPHRLEISEQGLTCQSICGKTEISWEDIARLGAPLFFLPDGVVLHSKPKKVMLLPSTFESFDELQELLSSRISQS